MVSKDSPATDTTNQVLTGSTVFGIFLNVQVVARVGAGGVDNIYMIVYKNPSANLNIPSVDNIGASDKKRYVIHQEMVMTQAGITDNSLIPKTLFKGFIKFPFKMKRNGIDDKWQVVIGHRTGEATQVSNFCLQAIFKEFR